MRSAGTSVSVVCPSQVSCASGCSLLWSMRISNSLSADTTSRGSGGDIGWFHKGQLISELEQALQTLKTGEVSPPVRSIYGFHIIRFEKEKPQRQLTFDEIDRKGLKRKREASTAAHVR